MKRILVAGLINVETTLKVEKFPLEYVPVRYPFHGVQISVSGVGYNLATALKSLGHRVDFLSLIGQDYAAQLIRSELKAHGISDQYIVPALLTTAQSVIIFDANGKRMIFTDLKDIQETAYPLDHICLDGVDIAVLANINFSRPMLALAKAAGIPIATDVHVISDLDDPYNRDYMAAADILFMSDEGLETTPENWVQQNWDRYGTPIIGIGLGQEGALLAVKSDQRIVRVPAQSPRAVVNTIGAGDALFSAFIHGYATHGNPYVAMEHAVLFAGYKIGGTGGADGFLNAQQLEELSRQHTKNKTDPHR